MAAPGLEVSGLCKRYGSRRVLDGLALTVAPAELVAVVGESGAGKSTLLNLIGGLEPPDAGQLRVAGQDIARLGDHARTRFRRQRLGFVFQSFHVLPHLTVGQNVELPLVLLGVASAERRRRATAVLSAVGLGDRGGSAPRELSGGELQRVAIARALVHAPAVLLADEPTGNLDPDTASTVLSLLAQQVRSSRATAVLVTHSAIAAGFADRVFVLAHGRLTPRT